MNELKIPVSAPDAKLWSVDDPICMYVRWSCPKDRTGWIKIPVLDSVGSRLPYR